MVTEGTLERDRRKLMETKGTSVEIRGRPEMTWRKTIETEGAPDRE